MAKTLDKRLPKAIYNTFAIYSCVCISRSKGLTDRVENTEDNVFRLKQCVEHILCLT